MSEVVPLRPSAAQRLTVQLGGQNCTIRVYSMATGLYFDLYVSSVLVVAGVICQHANRLVRAAYLGFVGDLAFYDTQGSDDPEWQGLGSRWILVYDPAL